MMSNLNLPFTKQASRTLLLLLWLPVAARAQTYNQGSPGAITITQNQKNAETINAVEFGVIGDGTTDNSAALQNAINAAENIGHQSATGVILQMPPGKINYSTTLLRSRIITIVGSGTAATYLAYTASSGYGWLLGDNTQTAQGPLNQPSNLNIHGGGFRDCTLWGPGYNTSAVAVRLGGPPNNSSYYDDGEDWNEVKVSNWGIGAQLGSGGFLQHFTNVDWVNNGQNWNDDGTCTNCGEGETFTRNKFVQSQSSNISSFVASSNLADYYFFGGSSDYNNQNTYDFSCTSGKAHLNFFGFHFEKAHGGFVQFNSNICSGEVNVDQSLFLINGTGQTDPSMISLIGTGTSAIKVNVRASQVASNEQLTAFVDANTPNRQITVDSIWWENYNTGLMPTVIAMYNNPANVVLTNTVSSNSTPVPYINGASTTYSGNNTFNGAQTFTGAVGIDGIGFNTSLPCSTSLPGLPCFGVYYKGIGVGESSSISNSPIFGVLANGQSASGAGSTAFTVTDSNIVQTFHNTLDDGNGGFVLPGIAAKSGTRFVCVTTSGQIVSQTTSCSGT